MMLVLFLLFFALFSVTENAAASSRPAVVQVGALFTFDSTIGRVAKVAIHAAKDDINADQSVLRGSRLEILMSDTNCSGFWGVVEGHRPYLCKK